MPKSIIDDCEELCDCIKDGEIRKPLNTLYELSLTYLERGMYSGKMTDPIEYYPMAKKLRNMIEVGSLEIKSKPHNIQALNMAKNIAYNVLTGERDGNRTLIRGMFQEQHHTPSFDKGVEEDNEKWRKEQLEDALDRNNNPAGKLAGKIIDDIEKLQLSSALKRLLPLTQYLVREEKKGNHILGTRDHNPDERMVDVMYCPKDEDLRPIATASEAFRRVLNLSEDLPEMQANTIRSKDIAVNMMADFHREVNHGFSAYDILRLAQCHHGHEPSPPC